MKISKHLQEFFGSDMMNSYNISVFGYTFFFINNPFFTLAPKIV